MSLVGLYSPGVSESEVRSACDSANDMLDISGDITTINNMVSSLKESITLLHTGWETIGGNKKITKICREFAEADTGKIIQSANVVGKAEVSYSKSTEGGIIYH